MDASRFMLMNLDDDTKPGIPEQLGIEDKWILSKYNTAVKEITANIEKFELGVASAKIYEFVWDILCDWYIELIKPRLFEKGSVSNKNAQSVLLYVLSGTLKLLHPFMPFITESICRTSAMIIRLLFQSGLRRIRSLILRANVPRWSA